MCSNLLENFMHYNSTGWITIHETENVKEVYFFTTSLQKLFEMKSSKISLPSQCCENILQID